MKRKRAEVRAEEIADAISKAYPYCRPLIEDQVITTWSRLGSSEEE